MELLLEILSAKRPYNDPYEKEFVQRVIIDRLEAAGHTVIRSGPMENLIVILPTDGGVVTKTIFSCHTDTVHHTGGPNKVIVDTNMEVAYTDDKGHDCLGADDGTGVWLMLKMIEADVPGTYIFHRGEERGCIGSRWMADDKPTQEFLKKYDYAIAFDRRDMDDIITHQRGRRCCSEEFALAFAKALNDLDVDFKYRPDPTGIYTDTANYDGLIKECTNISVGYQGAHGGGEMQDYGFAKKLLAALIEVDWAALPAVRSPVRIHPNQTTYNHTPNSSSGDYAAYGRQSRQFGGGTGNENHVTPTLQEMVKEMANAYTIPGGRNKVVDATVRIMGKPPLSLRELLEEALDRDGVEGVNDYLMALVRYSPEHAVVALRTALVFFQYYSCSLRMNNVRDSGVFGFNPTRTNSLITKYKTKQYGILFEPETTIPPYRPSEVLTSERQQVVDARKTRKAAKKAKKAAKKKNLPGRRYTHGLSSGTLTELKNTKDPNDPPRCNVIQMPSSATSDGEFSWPTAASAAKNILQ